MPATKEQREEKRRLEHNLREIGMLTRLLKQGNDGDPIAWALARLLKGHDLDTPFVPNEIDEQSP